MIYVAVGLGALGALVLLVWWLLRPPARRAGGDLALHPVVPDVHLYRGFFSNSAVLILPEAVVVVDTQVSPVAAGRLRRSIESTTKLPVTHVVNTHYHGDHCGGNALFPQAEIIATEKTARFVVERDQERLDYARTFGLAFQQVHPTIGPTRTFTGEVTLQIGGDRLELIEVGSGETTDACVVWWPARRVLACGDAVSTLDYPYLGVPFLDEGLRDDGGWTGVLRRLRALRPAVLLPGHGPPIVGEEAIAARIDLVVSLMEDLLTAVKAELAAGTAIPKLVERVDRKLRRYARHKDLRQVTVSQRFAIYRCVNSLVPERAGQGWWHDLRPSVIRRARADVVARERGGLDVAGVLERAVAAVASGDRPLAIGLLEARVESEPTDARAMALLSDVLFDGAQGVRPTVDGTEYIAAAARTACRALEIDPDAQLALLNAGASEVFGGMVLAQSMASGIEKLERAVAAGGLSARQYRKAMFFLGKAHQMELRDRESDRFYRQVLPAWARPAYPLVRARLRALP